MQRREPTCFLIAPIGLPDSEIRRRSDLLFKHVVRPAVESAGYLLVRADGIDAPGLITTQIINLLMTAELVIADLSGLNPNVMYELGIRHALRLPVIQLASRGDTIPFDVANIRTILYDVHDLDAVASARELLTRFISALEAGEGAFASPVPSQSETAQRPRIIETSTPDAVALSNLMRSIDSRLAALEHRLAPEPVDDSAVPKYSRRVFIVHGHDAVLKTELARTLERLDFSPIILHEQPDRGQTILGKLSTEMADVGYAFVILTPDDVGAVATDAARLQPRARQNVVFEHGLFAGRLAPARVCAIRRGDVEMPSDLHGVVYKTVPVGSGIASIAIDIVNELKAAGYIVDANRLFTA